MKRIFQRRNNTDSGTKNQSNNKQHKQHRRNMERNEKYIEKLPNIQEINLK